MNKTILKKVFNSEKVPKYRPSFRARLSTKSREVCAAGIQGLGGSGGNVTLLESKFSVMRARI